MGHSHVQTDADRARVLDGLAGVSQNQGQSEEELAHLVQRLAPRWFVVSDAHAASAGPILVRPRETLSIMRGPMTRNDILRAREWRAQLEGVELPCPSVRPPATPVISEAPEQKSAA